MYLCTVEVAKSVHVCEWWVGVYVCACACVCVHANIGVLRVSAVAPTYHVPQICDNDCGVCVCKGTQDGSVDKNQPFHTLYTHKYMCICTIHTDYYSMCKSCQYHFLFSRSV
jgi:hypothetical protein